LFLLLLIIFYKKYNNKYNNTYYIYIRTSSARTYRIWVATIPYTPTKTYKIYTLENTKKISDLKQTKRKLKIMVQIINTAKKSKDTGIKGKTTFPSIEHSPKKSKRSPYVVVAVCNVPANDNNVVVPVIKLNATSMPKKVIETDIRVEAAVTKSCRDPASKVNNKSFRIPINKHLAKKKIRKSFKFVMDPLRHLKSPNALTPRCNGYDRHNNLIKEKKGHDNNQRRASMKFTMDPLRHLKTPNVALKRNMKNIEQKQEQIQKLVNTRNRRPSMRFTLDPLRNLNYLSKLKEPAAKSP
jgi:hypothetical protein